MTARRRTLALVCAGLLLAAIHLGTIQAQTPAVPAGDSVPNDLRPLLAPAQSEMRLVAQHYLADRSTLSGNYVGGGARGAGPGRGGAAGRAGGPAQSAGVAPSINRLARLKRFDLEWQAAMANVDVAKLSAAARTDFEALKSTVESNLAALDAEGAALAELSPLLPFAPAVVQLAEARLRMDDVQPQKAAGVVTGVTKQIALVRARVEAGLSATTTGGAIRVGPDLARRSADTVDILRSSLTGWFNFYNGYDPLFTWWMGLPYKRVDTALQEYAALLRDKVAAADLSSNLPVPAAAPVAPAPAPRISSVPNLQELMALPQDEMLPVVQRFIGQGQAGGRGGGGAAPGRQHYLSWLAALKTLDFDTLSRNAQVDYLFIRKTSEMQIARMDFRPPTNVPRKTDASGIPGDARGRDGLILDLAEEMIPYTPEELIALANKEFARQDVEMKKASGAMGFGDDWKKALEKVKDMHPPPGGQPAAIRDMLFEAVDYLRARDLITVPQVASESLRMAMMPPERQLVNPFFTGGAQITVSYPTDTMEYDARMQSMRGNNTPFSHATAHHEMIPGHNLVGYIGARFAGYRARLGGTSFFGEGWPVYWETILYDMGFHDTPEERMGALFWLMHRSARIIFSLNFHMGLWSPQECIDFLVERVGHERDNATAEVRRSFQGGYGPLYQAAYLLGALQLRGLRQELVDSGQMTNRQFHDEILRQNSMAIAMLRLALTKQKLTRDMPLDWKFYGDLSGR